MENSQYVLYSTWDAEQTVLVSGVFSFGQFLYEHATLSKVCVSHQCDEEHEHGDDADADEPEGEAHSDEVREDEG